MKYWNKDVCGFMSQQKSKDPKDKEYVPYPEYSDEEVAKMLSSGRIVCGSDGLPKVEPIAMEEIDVQEQYESRVVRLIRQRYTSSQEIAILRQKDKNEDKHAEYVAWDNYCEECKKQARAELSLETK